jgi:choline-sulfatase
MPSRSAFLSGRRVFDLQTYGNCNVFQVETPSYGKVLADQGVHTVHIGKTDVYNRAATLGFSEMILPGDRARPGMYTCPAFRSMCRRMPRGGAAAMALLRMRW